MVESAILRGRPLHRAAPWYYWLVSWTCAGSANSEPEGVQRIERSIKLSGATSATTDGIAIKSTERELQKITAGSSSVAETSLINLFQSTHQDNSLAALVLYT
jgi:hypothetical protein